MGYEMKIGIEIEFYILKRDLSEIESNPESSLNSLLNLIDDFDHIYAVMKAHGINAEFIHKEVGAG